MKIYTVTARQDYPVEGIKKGDIYVYCRPKKRKNGGVGKMRFKTVPELNQWVERYGKSFRGEFGNRMEEFQERFDWLSDNDERDELVSDIDEFIDEKQSSLDNMPSELQESSVINEQMEELESLKSEVESWEE